MSRSNRSLIHAAAWLATAFGPTVAHANVQAQGEPPGYNANCHCYRNVPYGSMNWFEPTTRRWAKQVMDIWMPTLPPRPGAAPVVYYGHPNGATQTIALDTRPGSLYSRLVKPLLDRGFVVVSYEFRHPVVNYVSGLPAPRYDIQKAINAFTNQYAASLGVDPTNSFIAGQSRGGGLGLLTALTGQFTGGTAIRALWTYQAQTTFNCDEMARTFVIESDRQAFLSQCTPVPGAGSSLHAVSASAPPAVAIYERAFHKQLEPASEIDVHYPDFGWQLCQRYAAKGASAPCTPTENVDNAGAWAGMADYFSAYLQPPA